MADQGKFDEANRIYSEALRYDPEYAEAFYGLGNVKMNQGQLEEAKRYFLEALRLAPDDMDIRRRVESVR